MVTFCAPAEALTPEEVREAVARLGDLGALKPVLDLMPEMAALLSPERQILFANTALERLARTLGKDSVVGCRLGEVLSCRNLALAPAGCGTGEGCRTCGALHAMLMALHGRTAITECRISSQQGDAYDLQVTAAPFTWQDEEYALVLLGDISAAKRREVLERVFFHDVLNTAGGVSGLAALMADDSTLYDALKDDLAVSSEHLVNEIRSQQILMSAESGQLQVHPEPVKADDILRAVYTIYHGHPVANDRTIHLEHAAASMTLATDRMLLLRVIGNMVKNALEATPAGGTVTLGAAPHDGEVEFWCHNTAVIPRDVQLQLFQRSFSTKGPGRGIGAYSIKLLGEQYLQGRVGFTSAPEVGTRFSLLLPVSPA